MNTPIQLVAAAQKISTQFCQVFRLRIIQAHDKQGRFDHAQRRRIVLVALDQFLTEVRPYLSRFRCQDAQGVWGNLVDIGLIGILDDSLQCSEDLLVAKDRAVLRVEAVEPV